MLFSRKGGIRLIDEDVSRRTIAVSIKTTKLTGRVLAQACLAVGRKIKKAHRARQTPHGKQTVRRLMGHGAATNSIEVESPKDFDRVARKYGIDYSLKKDSHVEPPLYLVFFKSKDVDVMTAAFKEYAGVELNQSKKKKSSVRKKLQKTQERKAKHRQRVKTKQKVRGQER